MIIAPSKEFYTKISAKRAPKSSGKPSLKRNPLRLKFARRIKYRSRHWRRLAQRRGSNSQAFQAILHDGALATQPLQHRVVLYLAWGQITPAKKTALANLAASGLDVFVIVNRKASEDYKSYIPHAKVVMDRPNWGGDFGGWKDGVQQFDLSGYDFVYFVNDSIIGPWAPVTEHLDAFEQSEAQVFAAGDAVEWIHYIQSYFFGVSALIYYSTSFQEFWRDFMLVDNRTYIVAQGEMAMSISLWDNAWYVVAPCAEIHKNSEVSTRKILGMVGDGRAHYVNRRWKEAYRRAIFKEYHFPIVRIKLLVDTYDYMVDEISDLVEM